ncbi:HpcH/HpaI aldolase family protein [Amycolatopsis jiangsuensis]|uniref:4-hydroxy-2-oxoheptanedioate aldolase n=1 Tax=Amycolatopsis jiangsuensis TaxID=1181879 RepID=A0A840J6P7_9PSEU|nr:aldolase/citrate lyase family protein [Amycolatopsis jiangsuensis]MBB4689275.1 4-hydroxy-2-oxoheptanedioate aldolase [Amycolatopsis jiangsuensis]
MARLNGVIDRLERGETVFGTFAAGEPSTAISLRDAGYDTVLFETEHKPWDPPGLRDALQYLLDRRQVHEATGLAPATTPMVRIPPNGAEHSQWHAKQALDLGAYAVVWPHVDTVEEARNAVAACRYPSVGGDGLRGDSPAWAARYWGVPVAEYYERADVWPLVPHGEILVAVMIESVRAVENLEDILRETPGIGFVMVGEGDLSQELDLPRQYDHPTVLAHKRRILEVCAKHRVAVAHPHVTEANVDEVVEHGYRLLFTAPVLSHPGLDRGRAITGRS